MKKTFLCFSIIALSGIVWASGAVEPLEGRHGGQAGDTAGGSFLVTNVLTYEVDVAVTVADLPGSGGAVPLSKDRGITVEGSPTFRLLAGESRRINYRVEFPHPFNKPAAGAISLLVRMAGNPGAPPVVNRLLPVFLEPIGDNVNLAVEILKPGLRFYHETADIRGPKKIEVSVVLQNTGSVAIQPRGRVSVKMGPRLMETITFQGSQMVSSGATVIFSGVGYNTAWPDGSYEAEVAIDYGDSYQRPQTMEKSYFFTVSGDMISAQPGTSTPPKITPR